MLKCGVSVTGNCGFIVPFSLEFGEITTDLASRICRVTKTQSQGHGQDSFVIARFEIDGTMWTASGFY